MLQAELLSKRALHYGGSEVASGQSKMALVRLHQKYRTYTEAFFKKRLQLSHSLEILQPKGKSAKHWVLSVIIELTEFNEC